MRLTDWNKSPSNPKVKRRKIIKFLWFPVKIENEWRWFEHAEIEQEKIVYRENIGFPGDIVRSKCKCCGSADHGPPIEADFYHWKNVKWMN